MAKVLLSAMGASLVAFVAAAPGADASPVATTGGHSDPTASAVTLNGTVKPDALVRTYYWFEYGTTTSYGSATGTPTQDSVAGGTQPVGVSKALSGLSPRTTYHYRLVANNNLGKSYGADATFTTSSAPIVSTGGATDVTTSTATLTGSVSPYAQASAHFEYGPTTDYGSSTAAQDMGTGADATAASAAISGLTAGTVYHFRLVATNSNGTTYGDDETFATNSPPFATTDGSSVSSNEAIVGATVNPSGYDTTVQFQYGSSTDYGSTTAAQAIGAGWDDVHPSASITGLSPHTTYHYRVVATSKWGTTYGDDATMTTAVAGTGPAKPSPLPPSTSPRSTSHAQLSAAALAARSNAQRVAALIAADNGVKPTTRSSSAKPSASKKASSAGALTLANDTNSPVGSTDEFAQAAGHSEAKPRKGQPIIAWALVALVVVALGAVGVERFLDRKNETPTGDA